MRNASLTAAILFATTVMVLGVSASPARLGTEEVPAQVVDPPAAAWRSVEAQPGDIRERLVQPESYRLFAVDGERFAAALRNAPSQTDFEAPRAIVQLPLPDGSLARFDVFKAPVTAGSEAAGKVRTFAGQGLDDPLASVRLSWTSRGVQAQIVSAGDTVYVNPYWKGDATIHASYFAASYGTSPTEPLCRIGARELTARPPTAGEARGATSSSWGSSVRKYQVAFAADADFFEHHSTPAFCSNGTTSCDLDGDCSGVGGPCLPSLASRLEETHAAREYLVNNINEYYERDAGIRFELVDDTENVRFTIFWDPDDNDYPFSSTASACTSTTHAQDALEGVLGDNDYDIGHLISGRTIGGCAFPQRTCEADQQARGATGQAQTVYGNPWWVYTVRHETSHQLNAGHTFTGKACSSPSQMDGPASVEPGSGSTFMSSDGFCRCDNFRPRNGAMPVMDDHYHSVNLELMRVEGDSNTCWDSVATGNNAPTIDAGPDVTIPKGTPFYLEIASSGDQDPKQVLTYVWESTDNINDEADLRFLSDPDDGQIPLFRSLPPTTESTRFFPSLPNILGGYEPVSGEKLPAQGRTITMRVTARDNQAGGGGVAWDDRQVTVSSSAGPFSVSAPTFFTQWQPGTQTVTWTVAGTDSGSIDVDFVRITLSTDGGVTFDQELIASTANDGSADVTIPAAAAARAGIMVEAIGGVFFAVSPSFLIGDCVADADCDNGLFCDGSESCDGGGACVAGTDACPTGFCVERYDICGSANESYIISRNPDFSTDDRLFYFQETIYSLVWTDDADPSGPDEHTYHLEKIGGAGDEVHRDLCNRLDFTYDSASPHSDRNHSTHDDWDWSAVIRDDSNNNYQPTDEIEVVACVNDDQCQDNLFCDGPEYCYEPQGKCFQDPPPNCGSGFCDEELDSCVDCLDDSHCPDDGLFCNGTEVCQDGFCTSVSPPCALNEGCNEDDDVCESACPSTGDCGGPNCFRNWPWDCDLTYTAEESCWQGEDDYYDCPDGLSIIVRNCACESIPPGHLCQQQDQSWFCGCITNADCDDELFCTGNEYCLDGACQTGQPPCDAAHCVEGENGEGECLQCLDYGECDDGLFCNGTETCVKNECVAGQPQCAGQLCDEDIDVCVECLEDTDCPDDGLFCTGEEVCDAGTCGHAAQCAPNEGCNEDGDYCAASCPGTGDCGGPNCRRAWPWDCTTLNTGNEACWQGDERFHECAPGETIVVRNCDCESIPPGHLCAAQDQSWYCARP